MTDLTQQVEEARRRARASVFCYVNAFPCTDQDHAHGDGLGDDVDALIRLERAEAVHARARPHEDFWPHQYPAERAQLGCADLEAAIAAIMGDDHDQ